MFFPVEIDENGKHWNLYLRPEVNITLNKSFLMAYAYFNQVKLEEELIEKIFDDYDTDSTVFRTELYQIFKDSPIEFNFNQENFIDQLVSFKSFTKKSFEKNEKTGELKLFPEAVLGIFPQAGSYLVPDYQDLIENNRIPDIEEFFTSKVLMESAEKQEFNANSFTFLSKIKEEKTFTPLKLDAYQENAIKAIKKGSSVVVQGPPGTGKSQLISNLIADFISRGKNVLVVSQKRAALDVVYNRLKEIDANDFLALVHDFKNDRKVIYEKIARQIERLDEYKSKNNGLDTVQLERKFLKISRRIDQITEELEEFKFALFDEQECGLSVKELYLTSDLDKPSVNLKLQYKYFNLSQLDDFLLTLRTCFTY